MKVQKGACRSRRADGAAQSADSAVAAAAAVGGLTTQHLMAWPFVQQHLPRALAGVCVVSPQRMRRTLIRIAVLEEETDLAPQLGGSWLLLIRQQRLGRIDGRGC